MGLIRVLAGLPEVLKRFKGFLPIFGVLLKTDLLGKGFFKCCLRAPVLLLQVCILPS